MTHSALAKRGVLRYIGNVKLRNGMALAVAVLALLALGCQERPLGHGSGVVVMNASHCDLTVSIDGWEAGTVPSGSTGEVDNVGSGRHVLEAKDETGRMVERRYVEIGTGEDFTWSITSCPAS